VSVRVLVVDEGTGVWGAQRFLLRLAPLLRDRGVEQVLAAPAGSPVGTAWTAMGLRHVHLDVPEHRRIRAGRRISPWLATRELARTSAQARHIAALARAVDADVVHANVHWSHLDGAIGARLAGVASLLLLHEETMPGVAQHLRGVGVRMSSASVAVSEAVRAGVPAWARRRVQVVPNGVDATALQPGGAHPFVRAQLAADPSRPIVLAMCRLDPTKGVDQVIQAVAAMRPDLGAQLAVVGATGLGSPAWESHLHDLGVRLLGDRVRFLGHRNDVGEVLRAADVLALASSVEGMPLSVLEAQACGTPVACYPTAGIPEIVVDGWTGLLAAGGVPSLTRALERAVTDRELHDRIAREARLQVERHHHLAVQADRLAGVLRAVAAGPARGAELVAA
jgi:glycosyltransferase involved in cell wall biosynthesis